MKTVARAHCWPLCAVFVVREANVQRDTQPVRSAIS